jgi:transcriptional regulator with XRE-family HTH domain
MKETFGQYIRSLREQRGLTQRALSQAVGFRSLAHLSDIESGKRNPAKETFARFAKALGVSVNDLECRDIRGPIEAAKVLFGRKPEMVGAFLTIIEAAQKMDAEELVARVKRAENGSSDAAPKRRPEAIPRSVKPPEREKRVPAEASKPLPQPTLF